MLGEQLEATTTDFADSIAIADVAVADRHRRDMGDIAGLAASMGELGLLQPVVVRPDGTLIAGERRIRSAEQLGWTTIPVTAVDLDAVVKGEFAENAVRKDFTLSEAVAIKRALEPLEREAADAVFAPRARGLLRAELYGIQRQTLNEIRESE
jgi:ParB/RepB/Spo0J family partition protein